MAEIRREQKLTEYVDPVTGETVYRDSVTGEVVTPGPETVTSRTEVTEHTVAEPYLPATGQTVAERVVTGPAAPATTHTQESEVYTEDPYALRRARIYKIQQLIYLLFGILEGLLAIRFVLRLLGANPASGFASFIYGITQPFMTPFANLFGQPAVGGGVLEWNALVAIIVYALIAWVLVKVAWLAGGETRSGVRTSRVNTRIDR